MANYKGLSFSNSLKDFKDWTYYFPPLETGSCREFYEKTVNGIDYYCSFEIVSMMGTTFVGVTVRKYDKHDFEIVSDDEKLLFNKELERYKEKYNVN